MSGSHFNPNDLRMSEIEKLKLDLVHKNEILDLKIAHTEEVKGLAISFFEQVFKNTQVKKQVFETGSIPVRETYCNSHTDTNYDSNGQLVNTTTWSQPQESYRDSQTNKTTTEITEE